MIRSAIVSILFLPALAVAALPCGTPPTAPMPSSVPTPEMLHSAPVLVACVNLLSYTARLSQPAAAAAAATGTAYVPRTQHDNSPWRFDMSQNGRRMTADEFGAWMKAKGIRVAAGKPATPVPAPVAEAIPAAAAGSQ